MFQLNILDIKAVKFKIYFHFYNFSNKRAISLKLTKIIEEIYYQINYTR